MAATPAGSELGQPGAGVAAKDKIGTALACASFLLPIVLSYGGQAPGQGHRIEDTVSHDKISAAARERMAQTGEPY